MHRISPMFNSSITASNSEEDQMTCSFDDGELFQTKIKDFKRVKHLQELEAGDHVTYYKFPFERHSIVLDVNHERECFSIIRLIYTENGTRLNTPKFGIKHIESRKEYGATLRKVLYSGPCYENSQIIRRAKQLVNRKTKAPFTDLSKAFPVWCQTGQYHKMVMRNIE